MTCTPGSDSVDVSLLGGSPRAGLILTSGKARQQLRGETVPSPGMDQMIQATARHDSGPLAAFARTGDLSLVDRGRTTRLDASPLERPGVAKFFKACRA